MTCPHCGDTNWYDLQDGRSRCSTCYATFDKPKPEKAKPSERKDTERKGKANG